MTYEIVITLERTEGAPTIGAYSENPSITVVRDASVSDKELLRAYADALEDYLPEYLQTEAASPLLKHQSS